MTRIALIGATGRIGKEILQLGLKDPSMQFVAGYSSPNSKDKNVDLGALVGQRNIGVLVSDTAKLAIEINQCDVIIDFSTAEVVEKCLNNAVETKTPVVLGVTGLKPSTLKLIDDVSYKIPIIYEANFSLGMHTLSLAVELASKLLPSDFDVEITEAHHRHKKDAPSGTALSLAKLIAQTRFGKVISNEQFVYGRQGFTGERSTETIGLHSIRGGDIIGEQTVLFAGPGERLELKYQAHSRAAFAQGVMFAARFLAQQTQAKRYSMRDVINFLQNNSDHH
ncbi:MAG: dihydrodipicolinate reductase [Chlamydiales bacterium]|jgi:4-hydroxy-tetrahydrodipicolinate reductase|nr:dihydrodipicolinate reductase [Chlamydiales bacterium]